MAGKDAASLAGEDGPGQMGDEGAELVITIRTLVGEERWRQWQRWLERELARPGGRLAAREALGELKLQQDLAAHGHRAEPIHTPGAWWLSKFRRLSGHQRRPPQRARLPPG